MSQERAGEIAKRVSEKTGRWGEGQAILEQKRILIEGALLQYGQQERERAIQECADIIPLWEDDGCGEDARKRILELLPANHVR